MPDHVGITGGPASDEGMHLATSAEQVDLGHPVTPAAESRLSALFATHQALDRLGVRNRGCRHIGRWLGTFDGSAFAARRSWWLRHTRLSRRQRKPPECHVGEESAPGRASIAMAEVGRADVPRSDAWSQTVDASGLTLPLVTSARSTARVGSGSRNANSGGQLETVPDETVLVPPCWSVMVTATQYAPGDPAGKVPSKEERVARVSGSVAMDPSGLLILATAAESSARPSSNIATLISDPSTHTSGGVSSPAGSTSRKTPPQKST